MSSSGPMRIIIASAGRRAHYLGWFRDALRAQGVPGEVVALEFRAGSASLGLADRGVLAPAYNDPEYPGFLADLAAREEPDLFLSLNDYELQVLADGAADPLRAAGCRVAVLDRAVQPLVLDKHAMALALEGAGVPTPRTWLGTEVEEALGEAGDGPEKQYIVKHRYGSGSTGLLRAGASSLRAAVADSARTALGEGGRPADHDPGAVVFQPLLPGHEYGVDGVFPVGASTRESATCEPLGVLARRKDRMRGGDTDVATTVDPAPFVDAMTRIGELLRPAGPVDVDLRATAEGELQVIDINPRLGGGYPFCHRAGADLPAALVLAAMGRGVPPALLTYRIGVTTARREEFTVISGAEER